MVFVTNKLLAQNHKDFSACNSVFQQSTAEFIDVLENGLHEIVMLKKKNDQKRRFKHKQAVKKSLFVYL